MSEEYNIIEQISSFEKRLENLETKYANLLSFVEELNEFVTAQELRVEKLEKISKELFHQIIAIQGKNEIGDSLLSKKR